MNSENIEADFLRPFIEGTLNAVQVSCETRLSARSPFFKGTQPQSLFDITGVIGLTSENFSGSITLSFSERVYLELMGRMLGQRFCSMTPDVHDGAAELLNMIYGYAKVVLNKQGVGIRSALPKVVIGQKMTTSHLAKSKPVVVTFDSDFGEIQFEISRENNLA